MTKGIRWMLCAGVLAAMALPLQAGDAVSLKRQAQNKLLAYRAARVDGIRKLAERIKGLKITSSTTVRDFVTESDEIEASLMAFLNGMKEVGKPRYMADGTCEVTMTVKLLTVIATLEQIHRAHYKGDKIRVTDFQQMKVQNKVTEITEVGSGAPRPEFVEPPLIPPPAGQPRASFSGASRAAQAFWAKNCTGQGRLMAERAARLDAMRKLAARINGVYITGNTTVRDFVTENDEVRAAMQSFIKGQRELGRRYHDNELIVEVEMGIKLRTLYATLKSFAQAHARDDRVRIRALEQLTVKAKDKMIKETGVGVPPERYLKRDVPVEIRQTVTVASNAPPWIGRTLRATGNGAIDTNNPNRAQAKLMAFRAAEMDARRKLAEQIQGLMITSNTSVRDFVADRDEIRTSLLAFQQGAHVVEGSQKVNPDGTVESVVEIELRPLWNSILFYQRKLSIRLR